VVVTEDGAFECGRTAGLAAGHDVSAERIHGGGLDYFFCGS
jgi:hypothetical protein